MKFKIPQNEIAQVLASFKKTFRNIGVFSAVINVLMLMPAIYMLQLYDSVLTSRNEMTLLMLTLIMLGAYVFMGALEFVRSFVLIRVGAQLDMKLNKLGQHFPQSRILSLWGDAQATVDGTRPPEPFFMRANSNWACRKALLASCGLPSRR